MFQKCNKILIKKESSVNKNKRDNLAEKASVVKTALAKQSTSSYPRNYADELR